MPRKSNKRRNKRTKTRKQKLYLMKGCSKKNKSCKNNMDSHLEKNACPNCGPNCHCGPKCNCSHPCPGSCYLNRTLKGGSSYGSGCGSCGCPYSPLSFKQMNMYGGEPNNILTATVPLNDKPIPTIPGIGQNGGLCGSCLAQSGGSFYKPAAPIPGPIVGSAWGSSINKWPGVNGISSDSNYLKSYNANNNIITQDPALKMTMNDSGYNTRNSMVGGRKNKKSIRGGGLIPQDLVNLGSDFSYNLKSAYNSLNGYKAPVDPLPYKGQLQQNSRFLF